MTDLASLGYSQARSSGSNRSQKAAATFPRCRKLLRSNPRECCSHPRSDCCCSNEEQLRVPKSRTSSLAVASLLLEIA